MYILQLHHLLFKQITWVFLTLGETLNLCQLHKPPLKKVELHLHATCAQYVL